ncbi:hypothetical protein QYF36_022181 [Acer negundo]|nr:hypothetical protein QYF36_022181 [Acer negundo]
MLPFKVFVKNGNELYDMGLVEPGECSVISIINDAKKEFLGDVFSNVELMFVFEEFDRRNNPIIHFHISVVPLENDIGLLEYTPNTSPQETVIQENTNPQTLDITLENPTLKEDAILEVDDDSDEVNGSEVEPDYEYRPSGSVSDSDTSLVDSLDEGHVMVGIPGRCEPDGDKFGWENSSGEEDGPTRMVRYSKVGHVAGFNDVMKEIREVSEKAHTSLMKSKPHKLARHKFEEEIKSDHVTNNMSECFNSWIKEDRDKPILTLFETLRRKVMVRFTDKWVEIEKLNDTITSYTRNRLNETDNEARKLQVIHGRGEYHETMDSRNKPWLTNIAFQAAYSGAINPIPDASRWPTVDNVPLDPPLRRTLVGRPKKNRKREPDEGPVAVVTYETTIFNLIICSKKENRKMLWHLKLRLQVERIRSGFLILVNFLYNSTCGIANLYGCATTTTSSAKSALMKDCVLREGDLSFLDTRLQENSRHNQLSFPELQKFLVGREKITDERKTADGSVVRQDGVTAARRGRKDGKDDEGSDTSSFHPRSWPHVLVREGRSQRGGLTANSGFTTTRGLDGDEWVSSLLISEWVVGMARATGK